MSARIWQILITNNNKYENTNKKPDQTQNMTNTKSPDAWDHLDSGVHVGSDQNINTDTSLGNTRETDSEWELMHDWNENDRMIIIIHKNLQIMNNNKDTKT